MTRTAGGCKYSYSPEQNFFLAHENVSEQRNGLYEELLAPFYFF